MPLPVLTHIFRCAIEWTETSATAVNVFHIDSATGTPLQIATALNAEAGGGMFDPISSLWAAQQVEITPLDGTSPSQRFPLTNWVGGGGTDYTPAASVVVSLHTNQRGPRGRGRIFLPGIAEGAQTKGAISGAQAASVAAAWQEFQDDLVGTSPSMQMVVASYTHVDTHTLTSISCNPVLATQRRRQSRLR
jgi:hypothetical protein